MKFPERALDRAANLAIVIAVIVFLVLVGRGQFFHKAVSKAKAAEMCIRDSFSGAHLGGEHVLMADGLEVLGLRHVEVLAAEPMP